MATKIRELEYDKKINISKFEFSCDDIDDTIPKPLPQKGGFAMLIVGKPGMGKTTLILSLICKQGKAFNKKFDRVYIFSPSLITMAEDPFELIPEDQKFEEATYENLTQVLDEIKDSGEKVLLVLDDVIADIRGKGKGSVENLLEKIFFNRRHLAGAGGSLSIIATSQTYNKISPKLRKTASQIVFYENKQKKEIESIFEEMILIPKQEFMDVLRYIFDKKHNFMFIDTQLPDNKMIHKNFNQLEIISPNITTDFSMD
jgi:Cdc6-like AAA superfamily ATPase